MALKNNTPVRLVFQLIKSKLGSITLWVSCVVIFTLLYVHRPSIGVLNASDGGVILHRHLRREIESNLSNHVEIEESLEDLSKLEADDDKLIDLIKQNYLTEPSPMSERNLSTQIFNSRVTQYVHKLLNYKKDGFFVEVGANDGELLSNSLLLEVKHGWTGLLAEADPVPLQKLKMTHRNAWVASCCLSPEAHPKKVEMISHKKITGWANIPQFYKANITQGDFSEPFQVQCFPLYSLLLAVNRTEIDYFSLDIEGAELMVLETIPFDRVNIKVIGVETNKNTVGITKLLRQFGYKKMARIVVPGIEDTVYIKESAF